MLHDCIKCKNCSGAVVHAKAHATLDGGDDGGGEATTEEKLPRARKETRDALVHPRPQAKPAVPAGNSPRQNDSEENREILYSKEYSEKSHTHGYHASHTDRTRPRESKTARGGNAPRRAVRAETVGARRWVSHLRLSTILHHSTKYLHHQHIQAGSSAEKRGVSRYSTRDYQRYGSPAWAALLRYTTNSAKIIPQAGYGGLRPSPCRRYRLRHSLACPRP